MSTRSSIYYHVADEETPDIHIYVEMMEDEGSPQAIRMEISLPCVTINIALPKDLQEKLGIYP